MLTLKGSGMRVTGFRVWSYVGIPRPEIIVENQMQKTNMETGFVVYRD